MRVAVADVAAAAGNPVDPLRVIDARRLAEQDVAAPLSDAGAAHAGKVGLAARLHPQAGVHQVVPRVPLANAIRVHGADEVDQAMGGGDEDLLRPDAIELRDREVRQPIVGATVAGLQLADRQHAIAIGVRFAERLRHQAPVGLQSIEPAVLVSCRTAPAAVAWRRPGQSAGRCPSARSRQYRPAPSSSAAPAASRSATPCCRSRRGRSAPSGSAGRHGRAPRSRSR